MINGGLLLTITGILVAVYILFREYQIAKAYEEGSK